MYFFSIRCDSVNGGCVLHMPGVRVLVLLNGNERTTESSLNVNPFVRDCSECVSASQTDSAFNGFALKFTRFTEAVKVVARRNFMNSLGCIRILPERYALFKSNKFIRKSLTSDS